MKTLWHSSLFLVGVCLAFFTAGCATPAPAVHGPPAILIVLRAPGGVAPTPQQAAAVQQNLGGAIARAGLRIATSMESADYVLTATVVPDPIDPANGHLTINSFERVTAAGANRSAAGRRSNDDVFAQVRALDIWATSRAPMDPR